MVVWFAIRLLQVIMKRQLSLAECKECLTRGYVKEITGIWYKASFGEVFNNGILVF